MKVFKSINQFLIKYEFLALMTIAASMHLGERTFGIEGLANIGTLFFLIAIVSYFMKKYINKKTTH